MKFSQKENFKMLSNAALIYTHILDFLPEVVEN